MRDPNRIAPFLKEFEELWKKHPDTRFGQLVMILQGKLGTLPDPFYTEDDEMLEAIRKCNEESTHS